MKKYISLAFMAIALTFGFTSCCVETNEEPGGTNVEKMAGRWNVMVDAVDESGNVVYKDPYHLGPEELHESPYQQGKGGHQYPDRDFPCAHDP